MSKARMLVSVFVFAIVGYGIGAWRVAHAARVSDEAAGRSCTTTAECQAGPCGMCAVCFEGRCLCTPC